MSDSILTFAHNLACALGDDWRTVPPRYPNEPQQYAALKGPEGCGLHISGHDRLNWEDCERVNVCGTWPDDIPGLDEHPISFRPCRDLPNPITCALSRGPQAIAADILRRYFPGYIEQYRKQAESRQDYIDRTLSAARHLQQLAEIVGKKPDGDRLHLGSACNPGWWGSLRISNGDERTATIELRSVPPELTTKILELLYT